jgi:hypothetical protein
MKKTASRPPPARRCERPDDRNRSQLHPSFRRAHDKFAGVSSFGPALTRVRREPGQGQAEAQRLQEQSVQARAKSRPRLAPGSSVAIRRTRRRPAAGRAQPGFFAIPERPFPLSPNLCPRQPPCENGDRAIRFRGETAARGIKKAQRAHNRLERPLSRTGLGAEMIKPHDKR